MFILAASSVDHAAFDIGPVLCDDGSHAICRGRHRVSGERVLMKHCTVSPPPPLALVALRREAEVMRICPGPGVGSGPRLIVGREGEVPLGGSSLTVLVWADRGLSPLRDVAAKLRDDLGGCLSLATTLARALEGLHEHGVVHRGLHYDSVFASPDGQTTEFVSLSQVSRLEGSVAVPSAMRRALSPEQTGRLNRLVDLRCDLYALGAIFYELLTGRAVFDAADPLELAHHHLALSPAAPHVLRSSLPPVLSELVLRLLAKMPEQRFQSARQLIAELEAITEHHQRGDVHRYQLGQRGPSSRLTLSRRIYGRQEQLELLRAGLQNVRDGQPCVMMINGPGGVGKTALTNLLADDVSEHGGCFLSGAFDAVERTKPYAALARALDQWATRLEAESAEKRAEVEAQLQHVLGSSAALVTQFIPRLESVLGNAPEPAPAGPSEAQNRFTLAIASLLAHIAATSPPLVVLLENLHWADTASLRLLGTLLKTSPTAPVLWLGAVRDDELDVNHPLRRLQSDLRACGVDLRQIALPPLSKGEVTELLAESFHQEPATVAPLAGLVRQKTEGNPFFVRQLVKGLEHDGAIRFDAQAGRWIFDLLRVEGYAVTDNVVSWMLKKLSFLDASTTFALQVASSVGAKFGLMMLAELLDVRIGEAARQLWEAVLEGLVIPETPDYELLLDAGEEHQANVEFRFLHDRVQQAAYASIPESDRAALHLSLGRILLRRSATSELRLFDVVGHLNQARELVVGAEREELAELNWKAGRTARAAADVQRALDYFISGLWCLSDASDSQLRSQLRLDAAECEFISGHEAEAEARLTALLAAGEDPEIRAKARRIRIVRYENVGRFTDAVGTGLEALAELGFRVPSPAEREAALELEIEEIGRRLNGGSVRSLLDLPAMTDEAPRLAAQLMMTTWPSAFLLNEGSLTAWFSASVVRLSLRFGNTEESALGYITHAITSNARRGDYALGGEYAEVGLALAERLDDPALRLRVEHFYGSFLACWYEPLRPAKQHAEIAHSLATELGDFTHGARAGFMGSWYLLFSGSALPEFEHHALSVVDYLRQVRHEMIERAQWLLVQSSRALRDLTSAPTSLADENFDEDACEAAFANVPVLRGFLWVARLVLAYTFGDLPRARSCAREAANALIGSPETIWHHQLQWYEGLLAVSEATDRKARAVAETCADRLALRARTCPANFAHQEQLLRAELARLDGQHEEAVRSYEQAATGAGASENFGTQGLVHERFAEYWHGRGETARERSERELALSAYQRWGAVAKVRQLQHRVPPPNYAEAAPFDTLSALKATQAIAAELDWEVLLPRLMGILIENAGAERGLLLEGRRDGLFVVAEGTVTSSRVVQPAMAAGGAALPLALVQHVFETGDVELLGDATEHQRWQQDAYFAGRAGRSVLCLPVRWQHTTRGVIYLENSLATEVFAHGRLQVISMLATQAAISLENARIYRELKHEVDRRAAAETALQSALSDVERLKNRLQAENVYLQEELQTHHNFEEIVGRAPQLLAALRSVELVAKTDSSVLILGETGTGKELFARALHGRSGRSARPLVKVNCAAIASGLVESELFGHVKGAFTGALQARVGRFQLADGGTLFLDEVGELPLDTQAKLLRILQEHEFEPVGSSKTQRVDVRVIAATNRDLEQAVKEGKFRSDLLYRLNVFPILVPSLRERKEDIPLLVSFFTSQLATRLGKTLEGFVPEDKAALVEYAWPGNVRELANVVERAAILARGPVLRLDGNFANSSTAFFELEADGVTDAAPHDRFSDVEPTSAKRSSQIEPTSGNRSTKSGNRSIEHVEREHIVSVLQSTSWVVEGKSGAASILGLHPNTLRSRMKRLGITRPA